MVIGMILGVMLMCLCTIAKSSKAIIRNTKSMPTNREEKQKN